MRSLLNLSPKDRIRDHITVEHLRERLAYDAESGVISWRTVLANSSKNAGDSAGSVDRNGYVRIKVMGKSLLAHRVAWAIHYGKPPAGLLDHANGDKTDNRISNLREVTHAQNQMNRRAPRNNTSTYRGVTWNAVKNKWSARCAANGKRVHLGYFDDAEKAHQAYQRAASSLHGEYLNKE